MRNLWILAIVTIAALGAGCSSGSGSTATTAAHHATATTVGTAAITPGARDKVACASFVSLKTAGSSATKAQIRTTLKELRKANDKQLRAEANKWGRALVAGKKGGSGTTAAVTQICKDMGLDS